MTDWGMEAALIALRGLRLMWRDDPAAIFHVGRNAAGVLKDRGLTTAIANPVAVTRQGGQFAVCYRGDCKRFRFDDPLDKYADVVGEGQQ